MDDGTAIRLVIIGCVAFAAAILWLAYEAFTSPIDPVWAEGFGEDFPDAPEPKAEPVSPEEAVRLLEGVFDIHGETSK
jgi:hypothetical protein